MNFTQSDNRGGVEGFCLIKACTKKTSSKGDNYLDMTLSDKTGDINAKIWKYTESEFGEYAVNDLVKVRGTLSQYQGTDQLRVDRIRPVTPDDGVSIESFVQSADYSGEQMYDELIRLANEFSDKEIARLTVAMLEKHREKLLYWPAAYKLHHAIRGGLLLHTLSIVRLAERVCEVYPNVDRSLLLAGAMMHDIAKTEEFNVTHTGIASGYSTKGNLIGHLAEGAMLIRDTANEIGVDENTAMLLEHMVLSHHGDPQYGACVRPMFLEAILLSQLDLMDATVYEVDDAVSAVAADEFTGRIWALDDRKLYNHNRQNGDRLKLF